MDHLKGHAPKNNSQAIVQEQLRHVIYTAALPSWYIRATPCLPSATWQSSIWPQSLICLHCGDGSEPIENIVLIFWNLWMITLLGKCGRKQNLTLASLSSKHCLQVDLFPAPLALMSLPGHISRHVVTICGCWGSSLRSCEGFLMQRPRNQNRSWAPPSLEPRGTCSWRQSSSSFISTMFLLMLLAVTFTTILMRPSAKRFPIRTNGHTVRTVW